MLKGGAVFGRDFRQKNDVAKTMNVNREPETIVSGLETYVSGAETPVSGSEQCLANPKQPLRDLKK